MFQQLPQLQPGNDLSRSQMVLPPSAPWHLAACTSGSRVTSWAGRTARWKHFARKQSLLQLVAFGVDQPPLPQAPSQPIAGSAPPWQTASGLHCVRDSSGKAAATIAGSPDCQAAANEPCTFQGCRERGRALSCQWPGLEHQELVAGESIMCLLHYLSAGDTRPKASLL